MQWRYFSGLLADENPRLSIKSGKSSEKGGKINRKWEANHIGTKPSPLN